MFNSKLHTVDLSGNFLYPEGAQHLADAMTNNSTIVNLYLRRCRLGNEGSKLLCKVLCDCRALRSLSLAANEINSSDALKEIASLLRSGSLTSFDLSQNPLGNNGVKLLCDEVKSNTTLKQLKMSGIRLSDMGVNTLSEALLKKNFALEHLDISCNILTAAGYQALASTLEQSNCTLKSLNLKATADCCDSIAMLLPIFTKSQLKELNLQLNNIDDDMIKLIAGELMNNKVLESLDLSMNRIGNEGTQTLAQIIEKTNLAYLNLNNNQLNTEGGETLYQSIRNETRFHRFEFDQNNLSEQFLHKLKVIRDKNKRKSHFVDQAQIS
jgi:Ran GTPase-activating protein (RanGAP) involved in mRNA processing and transport